MAFDKDILREIKEFFSLNPDSFKGESLKEDFALLREFVD